MATQAHDVLDAAHALGVRWFDAARSYGEGERFLASWLLSRGLKPGTVGVSSKWGYTYTANWKVDAVRHEVKDHSRPVLLRQAAESREILGDFLRLYQIHSATLESGVLDNAQVLDELARLKVTGWAIGLSVSGPQQEQTICKAIAIQRGGQRLFDAVQATWNLLERSAGSALVEAHAAGLVVIIKEALANGRLTVRSRDLPAQLVAQATRLGTTVDALALAAVIAMPWVDVVLSGAATVEQIRSNAAALTVRWDAEAAEGLARIGEGADDYWRRRGELAWN